MLEAVKSEGKRPKVDRDLSVVGVGMIGGFEDANPLDVPATDRSKDVSYLYEPMKDSFAEWDDTTRRGKWKSWVVTDKDAAERAIRLAASKMDVGVTIRSEEVEVMTEDGVGAGVKMFFMARTRIEKPRGGSDESEEGEEDSQDV